MVLVLLRVVVMCVCGLTPELSLAARESWFIDATLLRQLDELSDFNRDDCQHFISVSIQAHFFKTEAGIKVFGH